MVLKLLGVQQVGAFACTHACVHTVHMCAQCCMLLLPLDQLDGLQIERT